MGSSSLPPLAGAASPKVGVTDVSSVDRSSGQATSETQATQEGAWVGQAVVRRSTATPAPATRSVGPVSAELRATLHELKLETRDIASHPERPNAKTRLEQIAAKSVEESKRPGTPDNIRALWLVRASSAHGALYRSSLGGIGDVFEASKLLNEAVKLGPNECEVATAYGRSMRALWLAGAVKRFLAARNGIDATEGTKKALELLAPFKTDPLVQLLRQELGRATNDEATVADATENLKRPDLTMTIEEARRELDVDNKSVDASKNLKTS